MQHLDEGTIHAWLDGALPEEEAARVEQHAGECGECAALVAEARGLIAGAARIVSSLDVVRGDVIPKTKPSPASLWSRLHLTPSRAALAATLLIAVASTLVVRHAPMAKQDAVLDQARGALRASPTNEAPQPAAIAAPVNAASDSQAVREQPVAPAAPQTRTDDFLVKTTTVPATALQPTRPPLEKSDKKTVTEPDAGAAKDVRDRNARVAEAPKPEAMPAPVAAGASASRLARADVRLTPAADSTAPAVRRDSISATAEATGRTSVANTRSLKPNDANPATQLPLTSTGRRVRAGQLQLDQAVVTATGATIAPSKCYMLIPDNSELARELPDRFALLVTTPDSGHVVRLVGADGRIGAAISGAMWRPFGVSITRVDFSPAGSKFAPITLMIRDGMTTVQASSTTTSRTLSIRPIDCHAE